MDVTTAGNHITAEELGQILGFDFDDKTRLHDFLRNMKIGWAWRTFKRDFLQRLGNNGNQIQRPSQETILQIANNSKQVNSLLVCNGAEWKEAYGWSINEHFTLFVIHVVGLERLESGLWENSKPDDVAELYLAAYHILVSSDAFSILINFC